MLKIIKLLLKKLVYCFESVKVEGSCKLCWSPEFLDYSISMPHFDELFCMDIQSGLSFGDGEFGFNVYYGMDAALLSSVSSSNVRTNFGLAFLSPFFVVERIHGILVYSV